MSRYFRRDIRYISACILIAASIGFNTYTYLQYMSHLSTTGNLIISIIIGLLNIYCPFWSSLCIFAGFFISFDATVNYLTEYSTIDYLTLGCLATGYALICRSGKELLAEIIQSYTHILIFIWLGSILIGAFHTFISIPLWFIMYLLVNMPMSPDILKILVTCLVLFCTLPPLICFAYEKTGKYAYSGGVSILPAFLRKISFYKP